MTENLFVIFAPGLGGNHLSNLISLSDRFKRQWSLDDYQPGMQNAHTNSIINLKETSIQNQIKLLADQSNVLCGHIGEYLWFMNSALIDKFSNRKFLIVSIPEPNTTAYLRLLKYSSAFYDEYFYQEQRTLYSQSCLERLFGEQDFFTISAETVFDPDAQGIINFIEKELSTHVDQQTLKQLHKIWYESVV